MANNNQHIPAAQNEPETLNDALQIPTLAVDLERAQIDQLIATAHRFPRSIDSFIKAIGTMACYNEEAAANCVYSLPRGNKPIIGPSIGFANIVAQAWGNNRDGARITYVDRKEKVVFAEGAFLDLQTNHQTITPVQRRIVDSKGRLYSDDMIIVTGQAAASIARRNAILNAIPRALWWPTWQDALKIVRGDVTTFAEHKEMALKAFSQYGVKPAQVFMYLGLKGEPDLTLEHIPILRGMYGALRDGSATVEEMFDPRRLTGTGFEQINDPLHDEPGLDERDGGAETETGAPQTQQATGAQQQGATTQQTGAATQQTPARKRGRPAKPKAPDAPPAEPSQAANPEPTPEPKPATVAPQQARSGEQTGVQPTPRPRERDPMPPQADDHSGEPITTPATCEEYERYATAYIGAAASAADLENRWKSDRALRTACQVVEDAFTRIHSAYTEKLGSLRG